MTFELNTQFTFDADAKDVRDFLIGDARKGWIEPEIDIGTFLVKAHCWLTPQPEANTLYGGSGSVSIHERHPLTQTFSPIAERSHFFKIAITQTEMGKCNVLWYVENDLNGWVGDARSNLTPEFLMKVASLGLSRWWTDTVNRWKAQTAQDAPVKPTEPPPVKPSKEAPLEEWFGYYHTCKDRGIPFKLEDIATETSYAYSYIRKKHMEYKDETQERTQR
jgi:hypothetical protein